MKSFFFIVLFSLFTNNFLYSQCLNQHLQSSREKAKKAVNYLFNSKSDSLEHVLFSIGDKWYLILLRQENGTLKSFYITSSNSDKYEVSSDLFLNPEVKIDEIFDPSNYFNGVIDLNSSFFYKKSVIAEGNSTYFYLQDSSGTRYGESKLSVIIKPNPIPEKVYLILLSEITKYIEKR